MCPLLWRSGAVCRGKLLQLVEKPLRVLVLNQRLLATDFQTISRQGRLVVAIDG